MLRYCWRGLWLVLVICAGLPGFGFTGVIQVSPTVETEPVPSAGDAADDICIWVHPERPADSTIIGTDKERGIAVYDLAGRAIQYLFDGRLNNVDIRYEFPLGGQSVALVTAGNRSNDSIAIYRVKANTRRLENVAARTIRTGIKVYGSCMYHSAITGKYYFYVNSSMGEVEQWELFDNGRDKVDGRMVRSFNLGSTTEGCVADDELGYFYIAEEQVGIWKYPAEPTGRSRPTQVDSTGQGGHLTADVEGLSIYYVGDGAGYLIASSQGSSQFVIYRRQGDNAYAGTFRIVAGSGVDEVTGTDGIDVVSSYLGQAFPKGVFVAQDDVNDAGNQNYKLVPWQAIARGLLPPLVMDASWNPRRSAAGFPVGAGATADKPQSKCWYHDDCWWCILFDGSCGSFFYRLLHGRWQKQTFPDACIYPQAFTRADVLSKGEELFVLEWEAREPRIYKYRYRRGPRCYTLVKGFPVSLKVPVGHETMAMDQDSTGALWTVFELAGNVHAICLEGRDGRSWSQQDVVIAEGLSADDIASVIAFDDRIGIFWSNQNSQSLCFRVHRDGASVGQWEPTEVVAQGGYVADDHINLAVAGDGRLYAVTKTSTDDVPGPVDGPTQAQIILNVRSSEGAWKLYDVEPVTPTFTTRPIVVLDETNGDVYVFYRRGGNIVCKRSPMSHINFAAPAMPAISVPGVVLNNVTSTKQNVNSNTGLLVLATGSNGKAYHRLSPIR